MEKVEIDSFTEQLMTDFTNDLVQYYFERFSILSKKMKDYGIKLDVQEFVSFNLSPLSMLIVPAILNICESILRQGNFKLDAKQLAKEVTQEFGSNLSNHFDPILDLMNRKPKQTH